MLVGEQRAEPAVAGTQDEVNGVVHAPSPLHTARGVNDDPLHTATLHCSRAPCGGAAETAEQIPGFPARSQALHCSVHGLSPGVLAVRLAF